MGKKSENKFFTTTLLDWNAHENNRPMPWKGEKDPYRIWLSEIILQQTRVDQGWKYYNNFIENFPTIHDLAKAPEEKVFKLWEGLGYYTRCKNLIATARIISNNRQGRFPSAYDDILALKGVGPYTAAAIASFAYDLPHAVVDGNVFRVLSRFFGIAVPVDSSEGKKLFTSLAGELLDREQPGVYNQALMDFGATVCKPQQPLCAQCVLKHNCIAFLSGLVNQLPVKEKSISKRLRWFYYIEAHHKGEVYVCKRIGRDIWENLYEFILVETEDPLSSESIESIPLSKKFVGSGKYKLLNISPLYKQQLTHQTIQGQFIKIELEQPLEMPGFEAVPLRKIEQLAFPKFIVNYLTDKKLTLNL